MDEDAGNLSSMFHGHGRVDLEILLATISNEDEAGFGEGTNNLLQTWSLPFASTLKEGGQEGTCAVQFELRSEELSAAY